VLPRKGVLSKALDIFKADALCKRNKTLLRRVLQAAVSAARGADETAYLSRTARKALALFTAFCVQYRLDSLLKLGAGQHHTSPARQTLYSDIGAYTGYLPFVSATWVRFAHTHLIADANFQKVLSAHSFTTRGLTRQCSAWTIAITSSAAWRS
jgi:hypothetical protein